MESNQLFEKNGVMKRKTVNEMIKNISDPLSIGCVKKEREILKKYGKGDSGLLQGGGYESTSFWIDPKRKFVGLLMTQTNQSPDKAGLGSGVYDKFRGALYRSFFNEVN